MSFSTEEVLAELASASLLARPAYLELDDGWRMLRRPRTEAQRARAALNQRRRYWAKRAGKRCVDCRRPPEKGRRQRCADCAARHRLAERRRRWRAKHPRPTCLGCGAKVRQRWCAGCRRTNGLRRLRAWDATRRPR